MKKNKTFFDEDIAINEKLFDNFIITNITSWSHLELWCAIQNIEVNYEFFKGILCGISVITTLYNIILDAIENTTFLDKFLTQVDIIKIIVKLFDEHCVSRTLKGKEFWLDIAYKQDEQGAYFAYITSEIDSYKIKKYRLLTAIFKKTPQIFVDFYLTNAHDIHAHDIGFETWLLRSYCDIKLTAPEHLMNYNLLLAEKNRHTKLAMYLN